MIVLHGKLISRDGKIDAIPDCTINGNKLPFVVYRSVETKGQENTPGQYSKVSERFFRFLFGYRCKSKPADESANGRTLLLR